MGSETVAFVVGPEPSAAADIVARKLSDLGRRKWTRMIGFQRLQSSMSLCWVKIAQCEGGLSQGGILARDINDTGTTPLRVV